MQANSFSATAAVSLTTWGMSVVKRPPAGPLALPTSLLLMLSAAWGLAAETQLPGGSQSAEQPRVPRYKRTSYANESIEVDIGWITITE